MYIVDLPVLLFSSMFVSLWGAIFSSIFLIVAILVIAAEEFWAGYVVFFVYIILMAIFTPANPFLYLWHNPAQAVGFFIGYFAIGAVYSTIKYWSFVKKMVNIVKELKHQFIAENKLSITETEEIPEVFKTKWDSYKSLNMDYPDKSRLNRGLKPGENKSMIMNWIAFWPFSAVGLFVADPLRHLVTSIYQHLVSIYGKMYEKVVSSHINIKDI